MTCAGVPYASTRPLSDEERAWLTERVQRLRRSHVGYGVGTAFVPIFLCLPGLLLPLIGDWTVALMIPVLVVCVVLPLRWSDAGKRVATARLSANTDMVEVYEGIAGSGAFGEASLAKLLAQGFVLDEETPQRLDRIWSSGETILLNGKRLDPPIWTDRTQVAAPVASPSEFPSRVPEFAFETNAGRRTLSAAEVAELRGLAPGQPSMLRIGCMLALCGRFFTAPNDTAALKGTVLALRAVALLYVVWRIAVAARQRTRLRRDLADGVVVRVESEAKVLLEMLPHLRLVWTVDGEPAPWRHAAQAQPRPPG